MGLSTNWRGLLWVGLLLRRVYYNRTAPWAFLVEGVLSQHQLSLVRPSLAAVQKRHRGQALRESSHGADESCTRVHEVGGGSGAGMDGIYIRKALLSGWAASGANAATRACVQSV